MLAQHAFLRRRRRAGEAACSRPCRAQASAAALVRQRPADEDRARGDMPWTSAPLPEPLGPGWLTPAEMTAGEIETLIADFATAARRADAIGCDFVEIHGAHGYLLQTFLSPLSNTAQTAGVRPAGRMAALLAAARAVREACRRRPLFFLISSIDGIEGGWTMDSVALAHELKAVGVDVIDCSCSATSMARRRLQTRRGLPDPVLRPHPRRGRRRDAGRRLIPTNPPPRRS